LLLRLLLIGTLLAASMIKALRKYLIRQYGSGHQRNGKSKPG
jgi:hypothetical protein